MLRFEVEPIDLPPGWSGSALIAVRGGDGISQRFPQLPSTTQWSKLVGALLSDADLLPGYEVLKYSSSGEVFRARFESPSHNIDVICKKNRITGLRRRLAAQLGLRPLCREFDRCRRVLGAGIDTALPLVMARRLSHPPEEWFIHEFVTGGVDLDNVFLALLPRFDQGKGRAAKDAIIKCLVDVFVRLRQHRLQHRDLKASNIMLLNGEGPADGMRLCLVDLQGLKVRRWIGSQWHWRPVVRLAASVTGYRSVTQSDYCRFLRAYLPAVGQSVSSWKPRYRVLARKATRYLDRSRKRKAERIDGYE